MQLRDIKTEASLPPVAFTCDGVQLFLYNAVLFNAHRIHFDHPYATKTEGYPDLVLAGPLIGDWLHQFVEQWAGEDGELIAMEYSNRHAAYVDEVLTGSGKVLAVDAASGEVQLEIFIKNANEDVIAPGKATVRLRDKMGGKG